MNGILIINKNLGYTSRDVVNIVSKYLDTKKIGHTGTLDPNASGVMILCIGKALKICDLLQNGDKEYVAEIILGIETDTLDMDTNSTIIRNESVKLDEVKLRKVVASFKGKYLQEVPKYSAVKVNGRKLYEYARSNTPVELPKKEVNIKEISIIGDFVNSDGKISFKIKCVVSRGTYIRSLVRDIGIKLNVPAVMNSLVRTRSGNFSINDSYTLDDIKDNNYKLIAITDALSEIPRIVVDDDVANKIRNGVVFDKLFDDAMAFIMDKNNNLLALYKNIDNKSRPYKMFI